MGYENIFLHNLGSIRFSGHFRQRLRGTQSSSPGFPRWHADSFAPTRFPHTRWDIANIIPRGWEVIRKAQRRIVLEKLSWLQINIDVFHMSLAVGIGKDAKACQALIASTHS